MATLTENIAQVKADFRGIRDELVNKGATVPSGTPTSQYANIIKNMSTGDAQQAYEQGRQDVIAESKYIEKSATGKFINLTDVSEVAHKVKVFGDGVEVDVLDNILRQPYYQSRLTSGNITWTVNDDGSVSVVGNSTAVSNFRMATSLPLESGKTYTFRTGSTNVTVLVTYTVNGATKYLTATTEEVNLAWSDGYELVSFGIRVLSGVTVNEVVCPVIYESGTRQIITATPTGTEVDSMCPNMTFISGEEIKVDYYSSFGMAEKELEMWNRLTNYGARKNYDSAFLETDLTGYTIPSGLCKPQQVLRQMFYNYKGSVLPNGVDCSGFDITQTAQSSHCIMTFAYAQKIKRIYDMGIPAVKYYSATYLNCNELEIIDVIRSNEQTTFTNNTFQTCPKLTHVIFEGIIASDINLQWSTLLDEESLVSLLYSLKGDMLNTTTITLSPESWDKLDALPPETWGNPDIHDARMYVANKGWFFA